MDNFTPLKTEKKKRKVNKFLIFGNLFLVILVALIGIFYYNQTLQTTQQKAAERGRVGACKDQENRRDCEDTCTPPKGNNNDKFECHWNNNHQKCNETAKICGGGGVAGGCIKVTEKCYDCYVASAGDIWHYSCDKTRPEIGQCNDNGKKEGYASPESVRVCFNGKSSDCGSEQFDWCNGGYGCFVTRFGPTACTGVNPTSTPTQTPTPTPPTTTTNTPTPTPTPPTLVCNSVCQSDNQCPSGLYCFRASDNPNGRCRRFACSIEADCTCNPTNTPTPTATPTATPTSTPTATPTATPTGTIIPSNTPTPTPTTPPGEPTNTPGPTATNTPGPSATSTPTDVPGAPTATPTEIVLAQTNVTNPPVPVTGMVQSFMYLIPAIIILIGLIL